jgi:hypothetical protein
MSENTNSFGEYLFYDHRLLYSMDQDSNFDSLNWSEKEDTNLKQFLTSLNRVPQKPRSWGGILAPRCIWTYYEKFQKIHFKMFKKCRNKSACTSKYFVLKVSGVFFLTFGNVFSDNDSYTPRSESGFSRSWSLFNTFFCLKTLWWRCKTMHLECVRL